MSEDRESLFKLGQQYFSGDGIPQDLKAALDCFERSAELGFAPAQFQMSYVNVGVLPALDPQKESALLESAAEKGDEEAMLTLGLKCEKGEGVPVDLPKAYALLTLVSISEDAKARPGKASEGIARIKKRWMLMSLKLQMSYSRRCIENFLSYSIERGCQKSCVNRVIDRHLENRAYLQLLILNHLRGDGYCRNCKIHRDHTEFLTPTSAEGTMLFRLQTCFKTIAYQIIKW